MACPTADVWMSLLEETATPESRLSLRAHLESCEGCQSVMDRLAEGEGIGASEGWTTILEPADLPEPLRERLCRLARSTDAAPRLVDPATLAPGAWLDGYRIDAVLGQGGMGVVYRAWDRELERPVAIKRLRPERAEASHRAAFEREARSAALLQHDHIVPVYTIGTLDDGSLFLVMPLIEGPTLRRLIRDEGPLPPRLAAEYIRQLADALAATHAAGIIHRDVKPGNVLIDNRDDRAKLTDFGLARITTQEGVTTRAGDTLCGTPEYLCPELIRRGKTERESDADVYALGVTLYECLTGVVPFQGQPSRVLHQILHDDPRPPSELCERVPIELESICLKAMAAEPATRYEDAGALRDDLTRWLRGEPVVARPATRWQRGVKWARRRPWQAATLAIVGVALIGSTTAALLLQRAYADARRSNRDLLAERAVSDQSFRLSQTALHRIVDRVSNQLFAVPNTTPLLLETYTNSVELHDELVKLRPTDLDSVVGLGNALSQLCTIQMLNSEIPAAEATYQRYLKFAEDQQARFPGQPRIRLMLIDAHRCRETLSNKQGDPEGAQRAVDEARRLLDQLASEHPDLPEVLESRVVTLMGQITDHRRARDYEKAVTTGRQALEALDRWRKAVPDRTDPIQTSNFLWVLQARSLEALGRLDEAANATAEAERALADPLLTSMPQRDRDWNLIQIRKIQARIEAARGSPAARDVHESLITMIRGQIQLFPEEDGFREDLVLTLISLGKLVEPTDPPTARAHFEQARDEAKRLSTDVPEVARYKKHLEEIDQLLTRLGKG